MRIRETEQRQDRLRRLMEATGENTKSGAIDMAVIHYLEDIKNKREVVDELADEHVEGLSTSALPLERDVNHTVGPANE